MTHAVVRPDDSTRAGSAMGESLGPYRIESKLGEGGMGDVYRALDTRLGRAVAVKIAQPQFIQRFEREARAISSLNHPHICTLYDVGPNYLVMELVEGETIAALLTRGPIPVPTALLYAAQILAALAEAHDRGVIHPDLKPGNIMVGKSGIKVLDFGLAKSGQDETLTVSGMVMGTPAYMPPEQRQGKPADARADIYSFGCVLYEMLTGARAVWSGYFGYEHAWSRAFTTAVTYGVVDVSTLDIQLEDAFHRTQRTLVNLMWNPVPFVDIVVEYLAGTRVNKNGQRASSSQIQSGWTLKF